MAEIQLKQLTKRWQNFYGAKDIDLHIKDREFLVLLGPSGCGKTTTMRMIAGLEEPTSGEVWIGDRMVNTLEPKDRDVAMVFQSYGLYPHLSTYDNICFPLKMRKVPSAEHNKRVMQAARMVEMERFLQRKPRALSGGQRQRVALARAIVREPNCFLMDEPLSNLDAKLRVSMRAELKHLQHELQVTTVFVTHDQVEAMTLADRVAVMEKGEIRQLGTPEEIYTNPDNVFVAGFIGSPAMNLIKGEAKNGVFRSGGLRIPVPRRLGARRCVLGLRAEVLQPTSMAKAIIKSTIYSVELLGDSTLVTMRETKGATITAKVFKKFRGAIGDAVGFTINTNQIYYFDQKGNRLRFS